MTSYVHGLGLRFGLVNGSTRLFYSHRSNGISLVVHGPWPDDLRWCDMVSFGVYFTKPTTLGFVTGRPASGGNEVIDAQTFADWGVDYLKEDSCNAPQVVIIFSLFFLSNV